MPPGALVYHADAQPLRLYAAGGRRAGDTAAHDNHISLVNCRAMGGPSCDIIA